MTRDEFLETLSGHVITIALDRPVRVGIDGPDAAGKTILADALAERLAPTDRQIVRAGIDGFHRPFAERTRQGPLSPAGYYEDSFDTAAIVEGLLAPLAGPAFPVDCRPARFDHRSDRPVRPAPVRVARDAILLFDGVFLFRPELVDHWDLRIYLRVRPETSLNRGVARDAESEDDRPAVARKYRARYLPGQEIYRARVEPERLAHLIVDNDDPASPVLGP